MIACHIFDPKLEDFLKLSAPLLNSNLSPLEGYSLGSQTAFFSFLSNGCFFSPSSANHHSKKGKGGLAMQDYSSRNFIGYTSEITSEILVESLYI